MTGNSDASQPDLEIVRSRFQQLFPSLTPQSIEQFSLFRMNLSKFNTATAMMTTSSLAQAETVHFSDCFQAAQIVYAQSPPAGLMHDFGGGSGFPGLVMAIVRPERDVVIVEREPKKVEFLNRTIADAQIKNAKVHAGTLEDLSAGSVKFATVRSFAPLSRAMLSTRKITAVGGVIFYMKGDNWPQELAGVPSQLFSYWEATVAGSYRISGSETDITIISTRKTAD